ncbi:MAG: flagellar basal body FlgE domain-containing protein, partial [Rhodospirillaceae bacterium]
TDASGQTVDSNNNSFEPDPTVFTNLETIRLNNIGGTADATENLTFGANLNAEASIGDTSNTTIQVFDSLGVAHNMSLVWTKATNNQWDLSINPPTQAASAVLTNSAGSVYASVGRLDFTTLPTEADSIEVTMNTSSGGTAITVTFDFTTTGAAVSGSAFVTIGSTASETANSLVAALNVVDAASGSANLFSQISDDTARVDITQVSTTAVSANFTDIIIQASATSAIRQSGSGSFTIRDLDLAPTATAAVTFDGSGIPTAYQVDDIALDLTNGAADLNIDFDFGTVGQADGLV